LNIISGLFRRHKNDGALLLEVTLFIASAAFLFGVVLSTTLRWWKVVSAVIILLLELLAWIWVWRSREQWWPRLKAHLNRYTTFLDAIPEHRVNSSILLASALGLYIELMVIRWHGSELRMFSLFKNISLISCFLGLGLGYGLGAVRFIAMPLVLPALAAQFVLLRLARLTPLQFLLVNPVAERAAQAMQPATWQNALVIYGFLAIVFMVNGLTFVPLGQLVARIMMRRPRLRAYGLNLAGSLLGIGLFTGLSYLWAPPAVWLLIGGCWLLWFLRGHALALLTSGAAMAVAVTVVSLPTAANAVERYSPYQVLTLRVDAGVSPFLEVNHLWYQRMYDLRPEAIRRFPNMEAEGRGYDFPYVIKPDAASVLVVGSGTGNDVAAAVRHDNVSQVDAVEIDPVILNYGRQLHPEQPYSSPRVSAVLDDARSYIRNTEEKYDLVVYGLLDAQSSLSGFSSVRLDSFVYTVEAFQEARQILTDEGLLVVTFAVISPAHARKMYLTMQQAFDGQTPEVYVTKGREQWPMFIAGPALSAVSARANTSYYRQITSVVSDPSIAADVSTDDWPFLYMPIRIFPLTYVYLLVILVVVSAVTIWQFLPTVTTPATATFFFLGAGFLLVETKAITELGLTFGNTWQVVSATIAGVLAMAYLANFTVIKMGSVRPAFAYTLIATSLLVGMYGSGVNASGIFPMGSAKIVAVVLLTLPLLFSGLAFSSELNARGVSAGAALGPNLLGAMVGGFLEYNSMYLGYRSLYGLALVLFALAYFSSRRARV
jgi:SAM-dependent methyltransferase